VPAKTIRELVALARARPGQIDYASSGSGSSAHLAAVLFTSTAGVKMNHIPYKGGGPAVIALLGGETSVGFPTLPSVIPHVRSGKLRALAVTGAQRSQSALQVPTVSESGVPGYEVASWYGLLVPAGTPREIITRLHAETIKLLKLPDVKERLDAAGFEVFTSTPEQYAAFTRNEVDKWARVVKAAGVRQE
jgi:tripartite-type tricarboxylate transporter receptor subunit TctC